MDSIVIYLTHLGARQAVSVRPIGLSCVEAVKDWVASLRPTAEPFDIAGLKNLATGQTVWTSHLPEGLGPGISQHSLQPGAEYEVVIGNTRSIFGQTSSASYAADPFVEQSPIFVTSGAESHNFGLPQARVYPVQHPFWSNGETSVGDMSYELIPRERKIANVYYLDEFGNRISGPEAVLGGEGPGGRRSRSPQRASSPEKPQWQGPKDPHPRSRTQSPQGGVPMRRSRSMSPQQVSSDEEWGSYPAGPASARKPLRTRTRSVEERRQARERLLMPRQAYDEQDAEPFDPNLRTVYRKMSPEDLDQFVYRMYAPHKHSAPRRDVYDERKENLRRSQTLREDRPAQHPKMDFRPHNWDDPERDEDAPEPAKKRLSHKQEKENLRRLYERPVEMKRKAAGIKPKTAGGQPVAAEEPPPEDPENKPPRKYLVSSKEHKDSMKRLAAPKKVHPDAHKIPDTIKPIIGSKKIDINLFKKEFARLTKPKTVAEPAPPKPGKPVDRKQFNDMMKRLTMPTGRDKALIIQKENEQKQREKELEELYKDQWKEKLEEMEKKKKEDLEERQKKENQWNNVW